MSRYPDGCPQSMGGGGHRAAHRLGRIADAVHPLRGLRGTDGPAQPHEADGAHLGNRPRPHHRSLPPTTIADERAMRVQQRTMSSPLPPTFASAACATWNSDARRDMTFLATGVSPGRPHFHQPKPCSARPRGALVRSSE
jgi:hypothetical protein